MNKALKQLFINSLIIAPIIILNTTQARAYSEEKEELRIPYQRSSINISKSNQFTVVVDAGHGGADSGAVNKSLNIMEKNLNIDIARSIEERLKYYGISVVMTRTQDQYVSLGGRTDLANSKNADLYVSIHNDTAEGNGDGAHIIHSVYDKNGGISKTIATNIGNSIKSNTTQNLKSSNPIWSRLYPGRKDLDYYYVIRETNMPAVIVEHSYMNSNDIKAVDTLEKRKIMGKAVADGVYKSINENFSKWVKVKNKWKYYDPSTKLKKVGWIKDADKWYYLDSSGEMKVGWVKVDNKWYYLESNGAMKTGWTKVDNKWYYLESNGSMKTGWTKVDNKWYYLESNGSMKTGWTKVDNKWYYLESNGSMKTGWTKVDNRWYYLEPNGAMKSGWLEDSGNKYFLMESGEMKTNWLKDNDNWYFLSGSGAMQKGWLSLGEKTYYLNEYGIMQTGSLSINGQIYNFNYSGELIESI